MRTGTETVFRTDVPLAPLSTLQIGGSATLLCEISTVAELEEALGEGARRHFPCFYLGEGSNVLFSDEGFDGLIVRNRLLGRDREGSCVRLGGGENLGDTIRWANQAGLAGLERLFGIPGTVAGAIVGNAGAYGQEIGSSVREAEIWSDGRLRRLAAADLGFAYRTSRFKTNPDWFLVSCTLELEPSRRALQQISDAILAKRLEKYPPGLRSPGSFFKNILVADLTPAALEAIPDSYIQFGKVPAGRLLEAVGANGTRRRDARIAPYHGNLLMNTGQASSRDMLSLAEEFAERVHQRFHVRLEAEIEIVGKRERN